MSWHGDNGGTFAQECGRALNHIQSTKYKMRGFNLSQSVPAHETSVAGCDASRLVEYAKANGMLSKWRVQEEGALIEAMCAWGRLAFQCCGGKPWLMNPQLALDKAIGFALLYYQKGEISGALC